MPHAVVFDTFLGAHSAQCRAQFLARGVPGWTCGEVEYTPLMYDACIAAGADLVICPVANVWPRKAEIDRLWDAGVPVVNAHGSNTDGQYLAEPLRLFSAIIVGAEFDGDGDAETSYGPGLELDCYPANGVPAQSWATPCAAATLAEAFDATDAGRTLQERWADARSILRQSTTLYPIWAEETGYGVVQHDADVSALAPLLEAPVDITIEAQQGYYRVTGLPLATVPYAATVIEQDGEVVWQGSEQGDRFNVAIPATQDEHSIEVYSVDAEGVRSPVAQPQATAMLSLSTQMVRTADGGTLASLWDRLVESIRSRALWLGVDIDEIKPGPLGAISARPPYVHVYVFPSESDGRAHRRYGYSQRSYAVQVRVCAAGEERSSGAHASIGNAAVLAERVAALIATSGLAITFDQTAPFVLDDASSTDASISILATIDWTP